MRPWELLTLSAKNEESLYILADRMAETLEHHPDWSLLDVCHTANAGRTAYAHRVALVASSLDEIQAELAFLAQNHTCRRGRKHQVAPREEVLVAYCFGGSADWQPGLTGSLYAHEPIFREAIQACAAVARELFGVTLTEIIYPSATAPSTPLTERDRTLAAFATQYALAQTWRAWGLAPAALHGRDDGLYAAACCAGLVTLEDGLRLTAARGELISQVLRPAAALEVFATREQVAPLLVTDASSLRIARVISPQRLVVGGAADAIDRLAEAALGRGLRIRRPSWPRIANTPLVEGGVAEFRRVAQRVIPQRANVALMCELTGRLLDAASLSADYWCRHVSETLDEERAQDQLIRLAPVWLELGLVGSGGDAPDLADRPCRLPVLQRGEDAWRTLLATLGTLYLLGAQVEWGRIYRSCRPSRVVLPTYPFQRERFWVETSIAPSQNGWETHTSEPPSLSWHPLIDRSVEADDGPWLTEVDSAP